jgi:hypothetical protein
LQTHSSPSREPPQSLPCDVSSYRIPTWFSREPFL